MLDGNARPQPVPTFEASEGFWPLCISPVDALGSLTGTEASHAAQSFEHLQHARTLEELNITRSWDEMLASFLERQQFPVAYDLWS